MKRLTAPFEQRLLIISHDIVGPRMAGPGIRYFQLAKVLAESIETTLAIPTGSPGPDERYNFDVVSYDRTDWSTIAERYAEATICLLPADIIHDFPQVGRGRYSAPNGSAREIDDTILIFDCYNPVLAEWLSLSQATDDEIRQSYFYGHLANQARAYEVGDFFICASSRQRDWLLGILEAHGRVNPDNHNADPTLRSLVDLVPYGLTSASPKAHPPVIKGVWPGIDTNSRLILWGGGLWRWLDPFSAIRAMLEVVDREPTAKLVFPGTKHPNPRLAQMDTNNQAAKALASEMGLLNQAVFFGDWVPYADWSGVLQESDIALSLHFDTLETRFAFRTRILDYIWASTPIVATTGDVTSDLVERWNLGITVAPGDVSAVATAICTLLQLNRRAAQQNFAAAQQALNWTQVAEPLIQFCQSPKPAADRERSIANAVRRSQSERTTQRLQDENQKLVALVRDYESGRVMRLMRWASRQFQ